MRDKTFNMERVSQQRCATLDEGLEAMLEMWFSTTGQRNMRPVLHGVTLHYSVAKRGKQNGKGQRKR